MRHTFDVSTTEGQKRLMRESAGQPPIDGGIVRIDPWRDHGADPIGNGKFRMVPSGDIVDAAERKRRLAR